jgi:predicted nucleic acid-binding protein
VSVLLDTGVLVAFVHADDPLHAKARRAIVAASDGKWGRPWTSDYILAEAFNLLRQRIRREEVADRLTALVFGRPGVPLLVASVLRVNGVLRVNAAAFASAHERYYRNWTAGRHHRDLRRWIPALGGRGPLITSS